MCIFVHFGLSAKLRGLEWVISSIEKQYTDTTNQENHPPSNASSLGILQFCSPSPMVPPRELVSGCAGAQPCLARRERGERASSERNFDDVRPRQQILANFTRIQPGAGKREGKGG